jgi:hypothetical protein
MYRFNYLVCLYMFDSVDIVLYPVILLELADFTVNLVLWESLIVSWQCQRDPIPLPIIVTCPPRVSG